jgi:signal transduction histidine kinase
MNIKKKLVLQFSIIVAVILFLFSGFIYFFSASYRKHEFYSRLEEKALTTAKLLLEVDEVDIDLMRIIDKNTISALQNEKLMIFDYRNKPIYASKGLDSISITPDLLNMVRKEGVVKFEEGDNEVLGVHYTDRYDWFVIVTTAHDRYGKSKLVNLRNILGIGLLSAILITLFAGWIFARQAVRPIHNMNRKISRITASELNQRLPERKSDDEIAELTANVNKMLERLEASFLSQRNFVSNASHELRTPLAAMRSQIEVGLLNEREAGEYKVLLESVCDDARALSSLVNRLLELAQADLSSARNDFISVRMDELLFGVIHDLSRLHPDYRIDIDFEDIPDDEILLHVSGNPNLLKTVFQNIIENACKFSSDNRVEVKIEALSKALCMRFSDHGIGIPEAEQSKIFQPFFRASNTHDKKGYGIGLSLCKKIVELHGGSIGFISEVNKGTVVTLTFIHPV